MRSRRIRASSRSFRSRSTSPTPGVRPRSFVGASPGVPHRADDLLPCSPSHHRSRVHGGLVQMPCGPDPDRNREAARAGVQAAAHGGAQVVCLQELFALRYFCQSEDVRFFDLAEEIPGPSTEQCSTLARELGVVIIAPVFERRAAGLYHNSAAVIDSTGDLLGVYRKLHIPDDRSTSRSSISRPGTSDIASSRLVSPRSGC